ncbi:MAG TPA: DMT family transporter [Pseudothermotoga sp.]|nr:DMT family transporter [Pseudothermotoga sp.]HOK83324.1 DMT family transporter [Pseudothermotoga sp.]HPP70149.1 DMT family transporter [Pseudothermotoga sp.]
MKKALLLLLVVTFIWGLTFPIQKIALAGINPFFYNCLRFLVALLLTVIFFRKKPSWKKGLILGLFLGIAYATQTSGLKITTSTKSGFITSLYIPFVPFFSYLIEKNKPTVSQVISFFVSVIGLYMLNDPSKDPFNLGDFLTIICAITFAIHVVLITHFTKDSNDEISLLAPQFLLTSGINLALSPLGGGFRINLAACYALLFTALFATIFAIWVQLRFQKLVGSNISALIYVGEPIFAALFSFTILSERMSLIQFIGMILLVGAILLGTIRKVYN